MTRNSDIRMEYKYDTGHKPFQEGDWVMDQLNNPFAAWLEEKLIEARNRIEELENG
jgi:hypothetical protein